MVDILSLIFTSNYVEAYALDETAFESLYDEFTRYAQSLITKSRAVLLDALLSCDDLTDAELARRLGCNRSQPGRWRRGESQPDAAMIDAMPSLAASYGIDHRIIDRPEANQEAACYLLYVIKTNVMKYDTALTPRPSPRLIVIITYAMVNILDELYYQHIAYSEAYHKTVLKLAQRFSDCGITTENDLDKLFQDWLVAVMILDDAIFLRGLFA